MIVIERLFLLNKFRRITVTHEADAQMSGILARLCGNGGYRVMYTGWQPLASQALGGTG